MRCASVAAHIGLDSTGARGHSAELEQLGLDFGALDFFCINDTTDDAHAEDPRLKKVQTMLKRILPRPSQFERAFSADSQSVRRVPVADAAGQPA
jgi:hypothetical protein